MLRVLQSLVIAFSLISAHAFASSKGGLGQLLPAEKAPASAQVVEVGFFPVAAHTIDESTSTYNLDFYMWMRWKGGRDPTNHISFANSVNKWGMTKTVLYEKPVKLDDGTMYQFMRVEGTFQEAFSLAKFPLDQHRLTIKIEDDELSADKLVYVMDTQDSGYSNMLNLPGWEVVGWDHRASIFNYGTVMGERRGPGKVSANYSMLSFELVIARPAGYFGWKLMLPLLVVLLSGLVALMLSPADSSTRIFMPSTALLTLVFLQQSYSSSLPTVAGLVLLDWIYVVAYLLTLLSLGWIIKAARIMDRSEGAELEKVRRLDRYLLIFNLGVFAAATATLIMLH